MKPNSTSHESFHPLRKVVCMTGIVTICAMTSGCGDNYRSDPMQLSVNPQLTAALQNDQNRKPLPTEVLGLDCAIDMEPRIGSSLSDAFLGCNVILRPEIAKQLKDSVTWSRRINDYDWVRSDGTSSLVDPYELRDSKFQFVIEIGPDGQPRVRVSVDRSRVPYGEASSLVLLAAERAGPDIETALKDRLAWTTDNVAKSWPAAGSTTSPVAGQPTTAAGSSADVGQTGGGK